MADMDLKRPLSGFVSESYFGGLLKGLVKGIFRGDFWIFYGTLSFLKGLWDNVEGSFSLIGQRLNHQGNLGIKAPDHKHQTSNITITIRNTGDHNHHHHRDHYHH